MAIYILDVTLSNQTVSVSEAFLVSVSVTEQLANETINKYSGTSIVSSESNNTLIE